MAREVVLVAWSGRQWLPVGVINALSTMEVLVGIVESGDGPPGVVLDLGLPSEDTRVGDTPVEEGIEPGSLRDVVLEPVTNDGAGEAVPPGLRRLEPVQANLSLLGGTGAAGAGSLVLDGLEVLDVFLGAGVWWGLPWVNLLEATEWAVELAVGIGWEDVVGRSGLIDTWAGALEVVADILLKVSIHLNFRWN